jgi:hypothetical protein
MTEQGAPTQSLGQPGEPCEHCSAPLAADQRYCLNCGKRRGGPRVDYRQLMQGAQAPGAPAQPQPATAETAPESAGKAKGERDYAPLAAVGGIAVLGLMLLIGVLIGRGDNSTTTTPAPVIRAPSATGAELGAGGSAGAGGSKNTSGGSSGAAGKKAKNAASEEPAEPVVQTSTQELEERASETGEEAEKNALKGPDKIATPGAPPPIDKTKPPGGGEGGVEEFE